MYTIDQINAIVKHFAEIHKKWTTDQSAKQYDPISRRRVGTTPYPEYWPGYNFAAAMLEAVLPHTRADVYPSHLLDVRAPNQTKEQAEYIRANYKPVTLSVFEDFKNTVSRAFADQNWSIEYKEETDSRFGEDTFEKYVNEQIETFGSIEAFNKAMLPTLKLTDANGIIAIKPDHIATVYTEDGDEVVSNDLIEPMPRYYSCKSIVGQEIAEYYLVISDKRSMVKDGTKIEKSGIVLYFFDSVAVYRIEQTGKKSDYTFSDPVVEYQHNLGYVPCIKLMGTPQLERNSVVYTSPFLTAVPLLDQVILDNSYLQMVKAGSAFPHMIAVGDICEFTDNSGDKCQDGQIFDSINGGYRTCPSCNGTGLKSRFSPSGMLLIRPKTSLSEGDTGLSGEYLKFVSPPLDTLEFLRKEIDSNLQKSRGILHLPTSDEAGTVGEAKTATGSLNKMRATYAFLKPISDQIFTIWEFMLNTIGAMRYGEAYGGVNVVYPTTFDINTPADYLSIVAEGVSSGVPPAVTYANVYNYIKSINYTDAESTAIYRLIMAADELLLMNNVDVLARVANGTVEKWQDVLHNSAPQLIMELMRLHVATEEAPTFLDLSLQDQVQALKEMAVSKVREQLDPIQIAAQQLTNGFA
jgi:hypothetical protein